MQPAFAQIMDEVSAEERLTTLPPEQQHQARELWNRLRCVVCSGQSVAQSNAPLARDIRMRVIEGLQDGKAPEIIEATLAERYGNDILLSPPSDGSGRALWLAPMIFLGLGLIMLIRRITKRSEKHQ